jgi:Tol biopolymer transport system component
MIGPEINGIRPARGGIFAAAALSAALTVACGCSRLPSLGSLVSRGGADLSARSKPGKDIVYRCQVSATDPVWTNAAPSAIGSGVELKVRCRILTEEADGWINAESEILEGRYEVDGKFQESRLAGQKMTYKYSSLRRMSSWTGPVFPTGIELLDIGAPNGRVKRGEKWKIEVKRLLLRRQGEIGFDKEYVYGGTETLDGEECHKLTVSIPSRSVRLNGGATLDLSGSGEVWIAKSSGRIMKATEILEGPLRDEKQSKEPGRFSQSLILQDAGAPAVDAKASQPARVPAVIPASVVAVAKTGAVKAAATSSTVTTNDAEVMAERLVFVSVATGMREIWSVSPDGAAKKCLTGYAHEHWAHALLEPEGKIMACVSRRVSGVNLWRCDLAAGDCVPLTEFGERDDIRAGWSDHGRKLIFLKGGKLWSVDRDGYNLQSFSLEGKVIDFAATEETNIVAVVVNVLNLDKIHAVNVVNGSTRELFEGDLPSWSPDGTRLAYRNGETLNMGNADGSMMKQLMKFTLAEAPILWDPASRAKVACTIVEDGVENAVIVAESGAGTMTRATTRGGEAHAFSPRGDRIAYLLHGDLWIASTDGSSQMRVTSDGASQPPVWWGSHRVR